MRLLLFFVRIKCFRTFQKVHAMICKIKHRVRYRTEKPVCFHVVMAKFLDAVSRDSNARRSRGNPFGGTPRILPGLA
jgi:hypothetical protein